MRRTLSALSCFVVVSCHGAHVRADPDYYEAFERADKALASGAHDQAMRAIRTALGKYPGDYALTLKLAWVQFLAEHYAEAERSYRTASDLSDGSLDARVGLGWSLIEQDRCDEGVRTLRGVLAEESDENADHGLFVCADRERLHGSIWGALGGSLYQAHPWLARSGAASVAFNLRPPASFEFGGAYRIARLAATDMRIPGFTQHEAYLQAGYTGKHLDLGALGGWVWGGDEVVGGSRHAGASLRLKRIHEHLNEVLVEAYASFYRDLWVIGLAPSATLLFWPLSITAGISAQQFEAETLVAAALSSSLTLGSVSVWAGGKYGPEYRAAYLGQFAVFNAQERSLWSILAGMRLHTSAQTNLFVSYALVRLESSDGLKSAVHNLSLGTAFTL